MTDFIYDHAGVRKAKKAATATIYPNQYYTDFGGGSGNQYKHIFVGSERILTKKVKSGAPDQQHWFYHGDHLGSTSLVTSEVGQLVDHVLYFPFGEVWVEERPSSLPEDFFFTAKEFDPETGFYDFGARYLNPRFSKWMSTDPALGAFLPKAGKDIAYRSPSATNRWRAHVDLPGLGGAFEPTNLATYAYSHHNPATLTDPTGLWSAAAHDYIIDVSLLGVASKNDISTIKATSRAFDAVTQGPEQAHMHSMTPPGFTPAKAIAKRDRFIEAKLIEARDFEQAGDRTAALRAFGEAIHPIMDSSSPLHVDPQGNPLPARSLFGVLVGRA